MVIAWVRVCAGVMMGGALEDIGRGKGKGLVERPGF